jgi:hypothetical protein
MQGILALIYMKRGSLKDCEDVLDVELAVLERFKRSSEGSDAATVCFVFFGTNIMINLI